MVDKPEDSPAEGTSYVPDYGNPFDGPTGSPEGNKPPEGQPAKEPSEGGPGPDELAALRQRLEKAEARAEEAESNYTNVQSAFNRRDDEIRQARSELAAMKAYLDNLQGNQNQGPPRSQEGRYVPHQVYGGQPAAPAQPEPGMEEMQRRMYGLMGQVAEARFMATRQNARELWPRVEKVLQDPNKLPAMARYTPGGRELDFDGTLDNIANMLELEDLRSAQNEAGATARQAASTQQRIKASAVVSGSSASTQREGKPSLTREDIERMSPEEMVRAGLVKGNKNPFSNW